MDISKKRRRLNSCRAGYFLDTHLYANTTSNAQLLGQGGNLGIGSDLNAQLAHANNRTGSLALLSASLRLALVRIDDGDTSLFVRFFCGSIS